MASSNESMASTANQSSGNPTIQATVSNSGSATSAASTATTADTKSESESKKAQDKKPTIASTENEKQLLDLFVYSRRNKNSNTLKTLEALLASGVNPDVRDAERGATPLMWICLDHDVAPDFYRPAINTLIAHHADINATNSDNQVPLHWATMGNQPALIEFLVTEKNANINAQSNGGDTALWYTARDAQIQGALTLLRLGALCKVPAKKNNNTNTQTYSPIPLEFLKSNVAYCISNPNINHPSLEPSKRLILIFEFWEPRQINGQFVPRFKDIISPNPFIDKDSFRLFHKNGILNKAQERINVLTESICRTCLFVGRHRKINNTKSLRDLVFHVGQFLLLENSKENKELNEVYAFTETKEGKEYLTKMLFRAFKSVSSRLQTKLSSPNAKNQNTISSGATALALTISSASSTSAVIATTVTVTASTNAASAVAATTTPLGVAKKMQITTEPIEKLQELLNYYNKHLSEKTSDKTATSAPSMLPSFNNATAVPATAAATAASANTTVGVNTAAFQ
jgi:ankyrin repeat protein